MIVGLTGQTGAGKSTVSKVFAEKGFAVINADTVARMVVEKGTPCLNELQKKFGSEIINPDDTLNRKKLGNIVFTDSKKLQLLNSIMYPAITSEIKNQIEYYNSQEKKFILLDAPTLFESNADKLCDIIISVIADYDIRKKRIMKRDNITSQQADDRINSQHSQDFFIRNSDYYIKNNDSLKKTLSDTSGLVSKIMESL
ncbi:MAG: dephospho-CoA kinase [Oscillospiraceae bacterium]|nr:dephospho-CoA kinase [Oscillospiraceae bacterium]